VKQSARRLEYDGLPSLVPRMIQIVKVSQIGPAAENKNNHRLLTCRQETNYSDYITTELLLHFDQVSHNHDLQYKDSCISNSCSAKQFPFHGKSCIILIGSYNQMYIPRMWPFHLK
jgi:hypothetical protein